jgi:hypothetical protein
MDKFLKTNVDNESNNYLYTYYYNARAPDRVEVTNVVSDSRRSHNHVYCSCDLD